MISFGVLIACMVGIAMASPSWYGAPSAYGGGAPLGPDGRVVDEPAVAQAKQAHLAQVQLAASRAAAPVYPSAYGAPQGPSYGPGPAYAPAAAHGPPAPLGPDGRVVDTPEVQAAKAHHFALFNAAAQHAPAGPAGPVVAPYQAQHADYNDGSYNPAWDAPAYNNY
ncbi:hypothetical protein HCN44_003305 [Aphidius gifuensis]|uniref:Cuticular protein n=1 Tax=Aphidius gifuensis TaxID=684658 RepID=A0A835CMX4_APHGI|nr:pupal cuticle protein-like isoform X2 [Aphidius gifuensis]KAF7987543.1 hypothetical protein HCN44_003305 [Aphidius gifuensis]